MATTLRSTQAKTMPLAAADSETSRLLEADAGKAPWRRWGPYLAERQWATVREDYSPHGECWDYFPHDHARSRAYRWGEDGLLGLCDDECRLCFGLALWNERDPILKERLFGLTGPEGNHGEDVKEHYFYLDSTPTHSYMRALYKYPQAEFPYARLVEENRRRGKHEPEFELSDAGAFKNHRYFDVQVEYAKASPDDVLVRVTISNRGPERSRVHVLPSLWFRNTWSWDAGQNDDRQADRSVGRAGTPMLRAESDASVLASDERGSHRWSIDLASDGSLPELLFTENQTNKQRLWGVMNDSPFVKDAFHERVVHGRHDAVNPLREGTKAAAWFILDIPAGGSVTLRLRLTRQDHGPREAFGTAFDQVFVDRLREADEFYDAPPRSHEKLTASERLVARQAAAGLLWSKQFYHIDIRQWLRGDPAHSPPPASRLSGRNAEWEHLNNADIISMPDKWEYPWYAAWDLAFQMIPMAQIDSQFAKDQLVLMLREWYMHPNGQLPAYEFAFGDVNPPVHAWACWRVYKMTGRRGQRDRAFLSRCFQKLLLNFNWWVNRKDPSGKNLFSGGFLGLDNIGVFDRSRPLPTGGHLEQADGTAWMAFYCGTMLSMALELAGGEGGARDPAYEDMATKFFEHFIAITDSINTLGGTGLWDEADGFYYDQVRMDGRATPLRVRSLVGLVPLLAVEILENDTIDKLPDFKRRMEWFLKNHTDLPWHATCACAHAGDADKPSSHGGMRLLAIPSKDRLQRVVRRLVDVCEFLSPFGIRSLSKHHEREPFVLRIGDDEHRVDYTPGESTTGLFGGNSNWRGPIWFPLNFLIIEALERYHHFYGDAVKIEDPLDTGATQTLKEAADEIRRRLASLFLPSEHGRRPCHGEACEFTDDPHWKDLVYFYEHFHADTGRGLGASHQTGWTALVHTMLSNAARDAAHGSAPEAAHKDADAPMVITPARTPARNM